MGLARPPGREPLGRRQPNAGVEPWIGHWGDHLSADRRGHCLAVLIALALGNAPEIHPRQLAGDRTRPRWQSRRQADLR
jgi:hypothetical protein